MTCIHLFDRANQKNIGTFAALISKKPTLYLKKKKIPIYIAHLSIDIIKCALQHLLVSNIKSSASMGFVLFYIDLYLVKVHN